MTTRSPSQKEVEDAIVAMQRDEWRRLMKGLATEEITVWTHEGTDTTMVDRGMHVEMGAVGAILDDPDNG